jgi:cellulose synthase/poly-beta-1,6-N-acetylglucosamine synthase-like glycosyltransferase
MSVLDMVFFGCLFMTIYPYCLYPLLVFCWSRLGGRGLRGWRQGDERPAISIIISVHNEEGVIQAKVENALALDYPVDRLEIVVVSDGSTDGTEAVVSSFDDRRVVLKAYERAGKTACLNHVAMEVEGEVLVFTDANSIFPRQMLGNIARNFADEGVGLVTGWTKYRRSGSEEEEASGLYTRLEKFIKEGESLISSCVGADGAIFAIRKELYRRLEDYDINDFVIPLNVVGQRRRVVLDPGVYCLEEPSEGAKKEFRRQARITNRTLRAIRRNAQFLNPLRYRSFAFFLFSHKVLRFTVPFFAGGMLLASVLLMTSSPFYRYTSAALCLFALAGVVGLMGLVRSRVINLFATFLLTTVAQLVGWTRFATGRDDILWTPQR